MHTEQHDRRRDEIITTARTLFLSRGYDTCTIVDIIDAIGIAKGTFYHYFRSKEELLEALTERMSDEILNEIGRLVADSSLSATRRIEAYFQQSLIIKSHSKEIFLPMLRMLYRPENTLLRIRMYASVFERVGPVLGGIVADGVANGEFDVEDPMTCGDFLIRGFSTLSEQSAILILEQHDSAQLSAEIHRIVDFMEWSTSRLLGLPQGSINLADRTVLDTLFMDMEEHSR
ncbi:MAG: TetR/AcrR family transcriptional regulator [Spirochaetales bacterium]|nr:TetR/AcrR family transcriptional regulator [Spirochaetales bacterium]